MKIAVVGSGYVGLVAAACFAELGHEVVCVDNDPAKLRALERGVTPIHEKFLPELIARHHGKRLRFSDSLAAPVSSSKAIFIAVGTPSTEGGEADLSYVEAVSREIAHCLGDHRGEYKIIVEKSTVPVYTNEWIQRVMERSGAPQGSFDVASNPEFLREGTAVTDFLFPDRIVTGCDSRRGLETLREIYAPLTSGNYYKQKNAIPEPDGARVPPALVATGAKSAELIKHASNAFLAMKISFINAVANVCEAVGADIEQVREGIGLDRRIGSRFLAPGIGYGGSCFPKDLLAFRAVAKESGYDFALLDEIMRINEEQRQRFVRKVRNALWTLKGKRLAALGLAFKGGTDDIRASQAIAIIQLLLREGCSIAAFDPAAMPRAREVFRGEPALEFAESAYAAAQGAEAVLLLTEWEEFAALDLERLKSAMKYPILVDGRNLYSPAVMAEHGFTYHSVGRQGLEAPKPAAVKASESASSS